MAVQSVSHSPAMKFTPRPFQHAAIDHAVSFLRNASLGDKTLYAAPTGVGKSVVELGVQAQLDDCWIVSPREEIITGMLDKLGVPDADMLDYRICTPIRLRNRLLQGLERPKYLIFDETHHQEAETWQQIELLTGIAPCVGYTASPYRGSPKSTRAFLERWGDPLWLINYQEAIAAGYINMPTFSMLPLVDDDVIEVNGGEFSVTSIDSATLDRLGDLAEHSRRWYNGTWTLPTIYAMPSSACCARMQQELARRGLPSAVVSSATPRAERAAAFAAAEAGILALLHINIVSEGVDLKLRRLVDAACTMSPVKWMQQLGRIMRPWDGEAEYICTNRNILRHAYILEGCVPAASIVAAEKSFPPTNRAHTRVLGMEALGRFKPCVTKLLDGTNLYTYAVSTVVGSAVVEFCCLIHPTRDPIWATKVNTTKDGVKSWGNWLKCESPQSISGFGSKAQSPPTPKQLAWWQRSAANFGLDPQQEVNRKSFVALPVLKDLGEHF